MKMKKCNVIKKSFIDTERWECEVEEEDNNNILSSCNKNEEEREYIFGNKIG